MVVPILGPVAGGLIVSNLSWRWIFYVNVPICVAGLVLAWRGLPPPRAPVRPRLDLVGLALFSPGWRAVLYGLAQVSATAVRPPAVSARWRPGPRRSALFAIRALRARGPAEPVIDLRLFRVRSFTAAASLMFVAGLSMYGALLLLPLYYQQVRGGQRADRGTAAGPAGRRHPTAPDDRGPAD